MPKRSFVDEAFAEMQARSSFPGRPSKQARTSIVSGANGRPTFLHAPVIAHSNERVDAEERRDSDEEREDDCGREAVASAPIAAPPVPAPKPAAATRPTKGIILRSGRIRLPDKLIQYLNNEVTPSLFWQPDGQGFSIDCDRIQEELLDKHFHGTKLSSFLRSLNRWEFKRLFYHSMPKSTLSFHHPLFRRSDPDLCKEMDMATGAETKKKAAAKASTAEEGEKKTAASASSRVAPPPAPTPAPAVAAAPAVATAASASSILQHSAASNILQTMQPPAPGPAPTAQSHGLLAVLDQMRTQAAAEAANKDLLLRQAIAAEKQRQNNLLAQSNNQAPNDLLQGVLSALITGGQQPQAATSNTQLTQNAQLVALAKALSTGTRAAPVAPTPPPPPPQQQAPAVASLLQNMTPAQQLQLITQIAASTNSNNSSSCNTNGRNGRT